MIDLTKKYQTRDGREGVELTQKEIEAFEGLEESYREMEKNINQAAPKCHFRPMTLEHGDGPEYVDAWWECSVCGHTKDTY